MKLLSPEYYIQKKFWWTMSSSTNMNFSHPTIPLVSCLQYYSAKIVYTVFTILHWITLHLFVTVYFTCKFTVNFIFEALNDCNLAASSPLFLLLEQVEVLLFLGVLLVAIVCWLAMKWLNKVGCLSNDIQSTRWVLIKINCVAKMVVEILKF